MLITYKILAASKVNNLKSGDKLIEKCRKLSKTRKLSKSGNLKGKKLFKSWKLSKSWNWKSKKLFKSQKLAKLGKKLSKIGNLPKFNTKKNRLNFLTLKAKIIFNHLWLASIKVLIF